MNIEKTPSVNRTTTTLLVKSILENADRYQWSLQGMGMLRTYLSKGVRLHIWHSAFKVKNVSTIHDHPWDFTSHVVAGRIRNVIYREADFVSDATATHTMGRIQCGVGGGLVKAVHGGEPTEKSVRLDVWSSKCYQPDTAYEQLASELHETSFTDDGTVTLVERRFKPDTEHARVCYPIGTPWISAEPRRATTTEVNVFVAAGLEQIAHALETAPPAKQVPFSVWKANQK